MVVQVPRPLLLTPSLVAVLLLQLERLHLGRQLLNLLPELANLELKRVLHVFLESLGRSLPLVRILSLVLDPLDLLAVLIITLLKVRCPDPAIFQRELQVSYLLNQILDLTCLLPSSQVCTHSLLLDLALHVDGHHGFLLEERGDLLRYYVMLLLQCNHFLLLFLGLSLHRGKTSVHFVDFSFSFLERALMLVPLVFHYVCYSSFKFLVHLILLLGELQAELFVRLNLDE